MGSCLPERLTGGSRAIQQSMKPRKGNPMTKITEKQFLEMPDRERDAWVVENIMGGERGIISLGKTKGSVYHAPTGGYERPHEYSTDYNAMMRVVEKMRGEGWRVEQVCTRLIKNHSFCELQKGKHRAFAASDDPKLAVYLAAGRAKEKVG